MSYLVIAVSLIAVVAISSGYSVWSKNSEIASTIKKSEEVRTANERVSLSGVYSLNGISTKSDVSKNINMSTLVENSISERNKQKLDNFQKAIKVTVIDLNIKNPTCTDLEDTGYITKDDCENIKDKNNNFVEIDNGKINVANEKVSSVINNTEYYNEKSVNEDGTVTYKSFDNHSLKANRNKFRKELKSNDELKRIINKSTDISKLKEIGRTLVSKYERQPNKSYIGLVKIEKVVNRIEYLKLKEQLKNVDSTDTSTISALKEDYLRNTFNSEKYFLSNDNNVGPNYLQERLEELKQKLN